MKDLSFNEKCANKALNGHKQKKAKCKQTKSGFVSLFDLLIQCFGEQRIFIRVSVFGDDII